MPPPRSRFVLSDLGDDFDFAEDVLRQRLHSHAGTGRAAGKILGVHAVEGGKIAHIGQEAGGLYHVLKVGAGSLQQRAQVLAYLFGL